MANNKICQEKITFIGTPNFGAIILEKLANSQYKPFLVVTEPDKKAGRNQTLTPPPVKLIAKKHKIEILQPEKVLSIKYQVLSIKPALIITAAYGQILPKHILDIPKYGCLNIHPSLLPKYRGPSPIQTAILNQDKEIGVSIILMDEKIDHGGIVASIKYQVSSGINYQELEKELAELGAELLIETIPDWFSGKIKAKKQNEAKATYTKIIKKEDGKIDWNDTASEIEAKIRAFNVWPGAFTGFEGKRLKIIKAKAKILPNKDNSDIGNVVSNNNQLLVKCSKGWLEIEELQLEGKKPMKPAEFLKGHSHFIGALLQ